MTYTSGQILTAAELNASFAAINTTQPNGDYSTNAATTAWCYNNMLPQSGGTLVVATLASTGTGLGNCYQIGYNVPAGIYADTNNLALRLLNPSSTLFVQYTANGVGTPQTMAAISTGSFVTTVPLYANAGITASSLTMTGNITLPNTNGSYGIGYVSAGYFADQNNLALKLTNPNADIFFQYVQNGVVQQIVVFGINGILMNTSLTATGNISTTSGFSAASGTFTSGLTMGGPITLPSGPQITASAGTMYFQSGSTYIPNMVTISNSAGMLVYVPFAAYSGTFTASVVSASASFTSSVVSASGSFTSLQASSVSVPTWRVTPVTGTTLTIPTGTVSALIQPAGTIANLYVNLPAAPAVSSGFSEPLDIFFANAVTSCLWYGSSSPPVIGAALPTSISAGTTIHLEYFAAAGAFVHAAYS